VESVLELDGGYVRAGEDGITEQPGLFVAGDVRTKRLRQIVTAVSDGANAVTSIVDFLQTKEGMF
jgi:thioredoxin reductase (NADPH)